jgi:hypothetical protein
MQNKTLPNIEWTTEEAAVFQRLTQHRQSTSVELIKHCGIQNPHGLIEGMKQKLAGTEWQIFSSVMRTADPKKTPVGYYRLLRKPLTALK